MINAPHIPQGISRADAYRALLPQIKGLLDGEPDAVANMANCCAILRQTFGFFWVGFYLVKENVLVLGPFQGDVACTRIAYGKGVCGSAWQQKTTIIVPDVDAFPGHIACSALSKSEIVVPIIKNGAVIGVLDIDSHLLNDFDAIDQHGLEAIITVIAAHL
jgi:L-methionine (R)-S-oxide reductase